MADGPILANEFGSPAITGPSIWLVTGCSTGFGRELARQLLAAGSRGVVTARHPADPHEFVGNARAFVPLLEVTDKRQVEAASSQPRHNSAGLMCS